MTMGKSDAVSVLIGFSLGAITGLLLAPNRGDRTRTLVMKAAADSKDSIEGYSKTVQDAVLAAVEQSKDYFARQQRGVGEAIKRSAQVLRIH
jgi:gas vesicle protein